MRMGAGECVGRIQRWFDTAIQVVDPRQAVVRALSVGTGEIMADGQGIPLPEGGRLIVLAIGKAAQSMAEGSRDVLGDRIDCGVILTKYGHLGEPIPRFEAYEAGHPVPDDEGLSATQQILHVVDGLSANDVVLCLVSGGGSALLELPREGVSLKDMQQVTSWLLRAGADIHDLNTVRKGLSQVKGGGLRRAIAPAQCISLLLSDVLGNDPTIIASGPTVKPATRLTALDVLDRFGGREDLSPSLISALQAENVVNDVPDAGADVISIIADNALFVDQVAQAARADGFNVILEREPFAGDAHELARDMIRMAREAPDDAEVIVRGGEATVTVTGDGTGGRNTEMALVAALQLGRGDEWVLASLASDGDDGNSRAAGAIADPETVQRARAAGLDPLALLHRNDSAEVFRVAGGLVITGPTGTNVNDVYVAVRCRPSPGEES